MMREEFDKIVSEKIGLDFVVPDWEYEVIEKVYNFYPSIKENGGKEQVADLYVNFGCIVFLDMLPRAKVMENIEYERLELKSKLEELKSQEAIASLNPLNYVSETLRDF